MYSATAVLMAKIRDLGYTKFSMNIWGGTRLYVNVYGQPSFYFNLEDSMHIVNPQKTLSESFFGDMRSLRQFLQRNRNRLLQEMIPGQYYVSKDPIPVGDTGCIIQTRTVPTVVISICGAEYPADEIRSFLYSLETAEIHPIGETLVKAGILRWDGSRYKICDRKAVEQLLDSGVYQVKRRRSYAVGA